MKTRNVVRLGVLGAQRVLVDARGLVFSVANGWARPSGQPLIVRGEVYERWQDVPFAWVGGVPFWRA
jgi:hypothetical protein